MYRNPVMVGLVINTAWGTPTSTKVWPRACRPPDHTEGAHPGHRPKGEKKADLCGPAQEGHRPHIRWGAGGRGLVVGLVMSSLPRRPRHDDIINKCLHLLLLNRVSHHYFVKYIISKWTVFLSKRKCSMFQWPSNFQKLPVKHRRYIFNWMDVDTPSWTRLRIESFVQHLNNYNTNITDAQNKLHPKVLMATTNNCFCFRLHQHFQPSHELLSDILTSYIYKQHFLHQTHAYILSYMLNC